jgi:hypothetical protein
MARIVAYWYRATCFGDPCGPWRNCRKEAVADLEDQGLGSRDEWGTFYVTVPGGIQSYGAWMDYDEWKNNGCKAA